MRCRFLFAGLLASVAAGPGLAVAADVLARPAEVPTAVPVSIATPPAYVPDWVGFYVGIHGGGGWAHTDFDPQSIVVPFSKGTIVGFPNASPSGGVVGGQVGHNWQWGQVVGGLEIDFSGADLHETTTFIVPASAFASQDIKINALASARGRLGYLIWPNLLAYGTAGIGWGHTRFTATGPGDTNFQTADINEFGWVAGAGLEWKFAGHWLLRGEWLHYDFLRSTVGDGFAPLFPGAADINLNLRTRVDVGRAALSYKF